VDNFYPFVLGGREPVHENFRLSIMVVFPQPFAPTIIVSGE
jgi:hypothetical protein